MTQLQPVPVQALEYQLPADAAAGPWAHVVRAVGWTAAALSVAHVAAGTSGVAFQWGGNGFARFDFYWVGSGLDGLLHVPALVGGVACARLRPYAWRLLSIALWVVLGSKALLIVLSAISILSFRMPWGPPVRAALFGQNVFSILGAAVPVVFMIWLLRRPGARQLFDVPQQPLAFAGARGR